MTQLEHDFIRNGRIREKRIIPLFDKRGRELHPLFARELWKAVHEAIWQAIARKRAPTKAQMIALREFVDGEFTDHNGNKCPVPNKIRAKALATSARVIARFPQKAAAHV